jgi:hypothetical protein
MSVSVRRTGRASKSLLAFITGLLRIIDIGDKFNYLQYIHVIEGCSEF